MPTIFCRVSGRNLAAPAIFVLILISLNLSLNSVSFVQAQSVAVFNQTVTQPLAWLPAAYPVEFNLTLTLPRAHAAEQYAASINDPASANYRRFLTPAAYMLQFGPSAQAEQTVNSWLHSWGLQNVTPASDQQNTTVRTWRGPALAIERAFGVRMGFYADTTAGAAGKQYYSNDRAPTLPANVSGLITDVELDHAPRQFHQTERYAASQALTYGLKPADVRKLYDVQPLLDAGMQGQGQTIAIEEYTTYNPADIQTYADQFGLPTPSLETVQVGAAADMSAFGIDESSLDIEMIAGIAPQAHILVYQAPYATDNSLALYSRILSDNRASIVTTSWGFCETKGSNKAEIDALHSLYMQGVAQGITFFAASGDSGAYGCNDRANNFPDPAVIYPASDPFVIGVGGTHLNRDSSTGSYASESAWASPLRKNRAATGAGSGGGLSAYFAKPGWQTGPGTAAAGPRQVPDVSADADPLTGYAIYCATDPCNPSDPWFVAGGTSASAPLWAAIALLVNQYVGGRVISNARLYQIAASPQSLPPLHDIVKGNNLLYPATSGYDMASGLGSPDAYNLARTLAAPATLSYFAEPAFFNLWFRTDQPVLNGATTRTWLWGPQPFFVATEAYAQAPNGKRLVQYFDKSRMEITNFGADRSNPYYVTNGLLAAEMLRGQVQVGDSQFMSKPAATIGVAGDPDDTLGPTYAALGQVVNALALPAGTIVTATLDRAGSVSQNPTTANFGVAATYYVPETKHTIAKPFWDFLNSQGLVYNANGKTSSGPLFSPTFYATGFPLTEAYWTQVKVGGQIKSVLVQAFERRILTYTPANSAGFQVEMGNVGRHYYTWRYGN